MSARYYLCRGYGLRGECLPLRVARDGFLTPTPRQGEPFRSISVELVIGHTSENPDMVWHRYREIVALLNEAPDRQANDDMEPITLSVQRRTSVPVVYDIVRGYLDVGTVYQSGNIIIAPMELECQRHGYGDVLTFGSDEVYTNGFGVVPILGVPGDQPPRTRLTISDVSEVGTYIKKLRIGRLSRRAGFVDGAFQPFIPVAAEGAGTEIVDPDAIGGTGASLALSSHWQTAARAERPNGAIATSGQFDVVGLVRDHTEPISTPTDVTANVTATGDPEMRQTKWEVTASNSTTLTLDTPVAGNFLYLVAIADGDQEMETPGGWTLVDTGLQGTNEDTFTRQSVYRRVATGTEGAVTIKQGKHQPSSPATRVSQPLAKRTAYASFQGGDTTLDSYTFDFGATFSGFLILTVSISSNSHLLDTPNGWTLVGTEATTLSTNGSRTYMYRRDTPASSVTLNLASDAFLVALVQAYNGIASSVPEATGSSRANSVSVWSSASLSSASENTLRYVSMSYRPSVSLSIETEGWAGSSQNNGTFGNLWNAALRHDAGVSGSTQVEGTFSGDASYTTYKSIWRLTTYGDLTPGSYEYAVTWADNAGQESPLSTLASRSVTRSGSRVEVDWSTVSEAASYYLYWRKDGGAWRAVSVTGSSYYDHTSETAGVSQDPPTSTATAVLGVGLLEVTNIDTDNAGGVDATVTSEGLSTNRRSGQLTAVAADRFLLAAVSMESNRDHSSTTPEYTGRIARSTTGTGPSRYLFVSSLLNDTLGDYEFIRSYTTSAYYVGSQISLFRVLAGDLPAGDYTYRIVAVDVDGAYSAPSTAHTVAVGDQAQVELTWNAVPNAASYRVYWQRDGGAWQYHVAPDAGYTHKTESGAVIADPPVTGTAVGSTIRLSVGVAGTGYRRTLREVSLVAETGVMTAVDLGSLPLPPLVTPEYGEPPAWVIDAEATGNADATVDFGGFVLLPHRPATQLIADGIGVFGQMTWVFERRRDGRTSLQIVDANGAPAGYALLEQGDFELGVGDNLLVILAEGPDGISLSNHRFRVEAEVTPALEQLTGWL